MAVVVVVVMVMVVLVAVVLVALEVVITWVIMGAATIISRESQAMGGGDLTMTVRWRCYWTL